MIEPKFTINDMVGLNKLGRETYPAMKKAIFEVNYISQSYEDIEESLYLLEIINGIDDEFLGCKVAVPEKYICSVKMKHIEVTEEEIKQLNNNEITVEDVINSHI